MQYQGNAGAAPQARMAYGAAPARQEAAARTELFTGASQPAAMQVQQPLSYDEMNNKQLMQQAVDTHKETTASAKRGLQVGAQACTHCLLHASLSGILAAQLQSSGSEHSIDWFDCLQAVEQMKEIQSSTQAALREQGEQMRRIETDMDKVRTLQWWLHRCYLVHL
jgi:hypothetical protein